MVALRLRSASSEASSEAPAFASGLGLSGPFRQRMKRRRSLELPSISSSMRSTVMAGRLSKVLGAQMLMLDAMRAIE